MVKKRSFEQTLSSAIDVNRFGDNDLEDLVKTKIDKRSREYKISVGKYVGKAGGKKNIYI